MRLYIDPGTGSMLFAILIGIVGAINYVIKVGLVKIKFLLSGGKKVDKNDKKIPYVIFSDNKRYWQIFEPIVREFNDRGIDITYLTMSEDDEALSSKYEHLKAEFIGDDNRAFSKLNFLDASILISTTPGLDVYQWKRSKNVDHYIHILHSPGDVILYRMFGIDYYDSILLSGEYQIKDVRDLEELRNLPKKDLAITGLPYLDDMKEKLLKLGEIKNEIPTVLLAPSWGPSAILSKFGEKIIDELINTGFKIIVRPHPQSFTSEKELMDKLMNKYPNSENFEWNRDSDNFEVLRRSDILISDFSSVTYEFALVFDKPIIYANSQFDNGLYDIWWLNRKSFAEYSLSWFGEELTEDNISNIKNVILDCLNNPKFKEGRLKLQNETWMGKGEGSKLTVDFIVNKYLEISKEG